LNLVTRKKPSKLNLSIDQGSQMLPIKDPQIILKGAIDGSYLDDLKSQRYSKGKKGVGLLMLQRYQNKANDFSIFDIEKRLGQYKRQF